MKFRTEIFPNSGDFKISYNCKIAMQGSCFAENMASKFLNAGFNIDINPFGIAYNPFSLSQNLKRLISKKPFVEDELFKDNDIYHSFSHHSRFSGIDKNKVLSGINSRLEQSSLFLQNAGLLIITFGTAFVYRLKSDNSIVSNCHKLPANYFTYKRLTIDEILSEWNGIIFQIKNFNPSLQILFTVSPIRHWKDGAHENSLSKAILLLSVDKLIENNSNCSYFPSYELLIDDLRDYRFYNEDMLHPTSQAIDYIWEKFSVAFFDDETSKKVREFEKINKSLNHIPLIPESEEYKKFKEKIEDRLLDRNIDSAFNQK